MYRQAVVTTILLAVFLDFAHANAAAGTFKIVTASERGTYYVFGKDLSKIVAPDADIPLEVVATSGSATNVKLLRYEPGVKLAIVQADVYRAFIDRGRANADAARITDGLRVLLPLYDTEIHYIVRADSNLNYLHDIRDARINGGLVGSGAAFITHTLYRMMFNAPVPEANATYLSNEDALVKLVTDKTVDVVVVAAGQPAPLIANMKPEAQKYIKLLKLDPTHASSKLPLTVYTPYTIRTSSYPNLLTQNITTIAVGAMLMTYNYQTREAVDDLERFARSLCENLPKLQAEGHPKWREVSLELPHIGSGWTYYKPTAREIRRCVANSKQRTVPMKVCAPEDRILGLCK
jgi:TRAP transporter TAXI family solute receptor